MALIIQKIDILNNKKNRKRFINLSWEIYKDSPNWIAPLKLKVESILKKDHPFYLISKVAFWIAVKDGKDVGRIMAIENYEHNKFHQEKSGHYGFFEAIEEKAVFKELFESASTWLKSQGMEKIQGPFNPSINYECGNLIDGYDEKPILMMSYNPPYYQKYIEDLNFVKAKDLLSYHTPTDFQQPDIILKIAQRAEKSNQITYRTLSRKNWDEEIKILHDVYNNAWEKNWGFVPMTKEEFFHMGKELKEGVDENLILLPMVNGEIAGFFLALPNFNEVFEKIPSGKLFPTGIFKLLMASRYITGVRVLTMGIKKKFRHLGLATILYTRGHEAIKKSKDYKDIDMSWILEDNLNMIKPLERMKAKPYRRYRIFEKDL